MSSLRHSEGQGSLANCRPRGHKDLDTTKPLNNNTELLKLGLNVNAPWGLWLKPFSNSGFSSRIMCFFRVMSGNLQNFTKTSSQKAEDTVFRFYKHVRGCACRKVEALGKRHRAHVKRVKTLLLTQLSQWRGRWELTGFVINGQDLSAAWFHTIVFLAKNKNHHFSTQKWE